MEFGDTKARVFQALRVWDEFLAPVVFDAFAAEKSDFSDNNAQNETKN